MLRINRVARGLLSLFDSKTSGQPPQTLADEIRATVDLGELLQWGAAENISGEVVPTSTEGFYPTTNGAGDVPQSETWILLRASITGRALVGAGDAYGGAIAIRTLGSGSIQNQDHILNVNQSYGPGLLPAFYMAAPPPIILHPGDRLGFLAISTTFAAAAPQADLIARVLKLRV